MCKILATVTTTSKTLLARLTVETSAIMSHLVVSRTLLRNGMKSETSTINNDQTRTVTHYCTVSRRFTICTSLTVSHLLSGLPRRRPHYALISELSVCLSVRPSDYVPRLPRIKEWNQRKFVPQLSGRCDARSSFEEKVNGQGHKNTQTQCSDKKYAITP